MMINFDKFLASFITEMKKYQPVTCYNLPGCIKKALEDQGLEYKGGEIVKSQRRVSAEAKENGYGESEDEEIVKLADEYYDKVLIKECDMEEKEAHHCRISYIHGAKAMLEKQDEHKKFRDSIQIGDRVTRNEDGVLVNLSQLNRVAKKDKKQGEQKPANIEPKFGIGWWITSDNVHDDFRICKVVGVDAINGCYSVESIDGNKGYNSFETFDKLYHEWTIQDAKGGDIISAEPTEGWSSPFIAIYKCGGIDSFDSYCIVDFDGEFSGGFDGHYVDNIHPATKEQRNILFSKMHEDGYTFDFEKKELKKLKFKVGDEVITENEKSLTITKIDEEGYWSNDLFICGFNTEHIWDLVEQKSTWKPSDEQMNAFKQACDLYNTHFAQSLALNSLYYDLKKLKGE